MLVAARAGGSTSWAAYGVPDTADAEIGSVSKGLTGLLLHEAIDRAEVSLGTTLGGALGRPEASYAPLTLGAVASHRSGLPSQPPMPGERSLARRTWRMWRHGENPYGDSVADLLDQAADARIGRDRFVYSNLGFELLGAALARAAGDCFPGVLRERVLEPLGMTRAHVPVREADLRPESLTGRSRGGRPHAAWVGDAIGPAGGVRCTAADLAALLDGLVERSAPGIGALEARADATGGSRIGAAWLTTSVRGREVVWHNGRTGGFASWVGVDRARETAVAIVSATAMSVDDAGFRSLEALSP
ncbi:hypothetical protein Dac01nite_02410 [Demequina activiva]|uniref:Beta-lactamase-related domain-containing protein n=1 Tax=Demequina activiva TaxID=1582364 RepID=A0A919Q0L7_9MICO|nr:hypothetical protein Dac01nite_02410 [Demequina activiva]